MALTPNSPFNVDDTFTDAQGDGQTVHTSQPNTDDPTPTCTVTGTNSADWTCDVTETPGENNCTLDVPASAAQMNLSPKAKEQFVQALIDICSTDGANGLATCDPCGLRLRGDPVLGPPPSGR